MKSLAYKDQVNYESRAVGKSQMDCVAAAPALPDVGPEIPIAQTTYCLAEGNHLLRLMERGNWVAGFQTPTAFGNHFIASSIDLAKDKQIVGRLHVDSITPVPDFTALAAAPTAGAHLNKGHRDDLIPFPTETVHGLPVNKATDLLPLSGRTGTVLMTVHVSDAGHVETVTIAESPNQFLSNAAMAVVREYHYRLAYRNLKPVAVDEMV